LRRAGDPGRLGGGLTQAPEEVLALQVQHYALAAGAANPNDAGCATDWKMPIGTSLVCAQHR
jgi:hypothetical protein